MNSVAQLRGDTMGRLGKRIYEFWEGSKVWACVERPLM